MRDRLAGLVAVVHHQAEVVPDAALPRHAPDSLKQPAAEGFVLQVRKPLDVLLRHDQNMERRAREDIVDRHDVVVLIDDGRGDLPGHDAAEQAVVHATKRIPTCP